MGIGSAAFIDFLASFNVTSADFAHQWLLNEGIKPKSLGWKNSIYNKMELTVGINVHNGFTINTRTGVTEQHVYNEIKAAINEWQVRPEMFCAAKDIDLKLNVVELDGGLGFASCLLENNMDSSACRISNAVANANLDIYIPGNYFGQCHICIDLFFSYPTTDCLFFHTNLLTRICRPFLEQHRRWDCGYLLKFNILF